MDQFFRKYLLFQGYAFSFAAIVGAGYVTYEGLTDEHQYFHAEMFYDFRFMNHWAILIAICWCCVGVSLIYGLYKEDVGFLYPFPIMFCVEVFLMMLRDIVMYFTEKESWYFHEYNVFLNPLTIAETFFLTIHVMMTMIGLSKMFALVPGTRSGGKFREFSFTWTEIAGEQPRQMDADELQAAAS